MVQCSGMCMSARAQVRVSVCECAVWVYLAVFATVPALGPPCWWRPVGPTSAHCWWWETCGKKLSVSGPLSLIFHPLTPQHHLFFPLFFLSFNPRSPLLCFIKHCPSRSLLFFFIPSLPTSSQTVQRRIISNQSALWIFKKKRFLRVYIQRAVSLEMLPKSSSTFFWIFNKKKIIQRKHKDSGEMVYMKAFYSLTWSHGV